MSGAELAEVLYESDLTAGDFVRWARQVADALGQLAEAAGATALRTTCRAAIGAIRRGVVEAAPMED